MTFSAQTKRELCRIEPESVCCYLAELSGIICASGSIILRGHGEKRLSIETENNALARRTFKLFKKVFEISPELVTLQHARLGGKNTYRLNLSSEDAEFVLEGCGIDMSKRAVPKDVTSRKCCRKAFLRGVFLACGSVTDPGKDYHLELVLNDEGFADALQRFIQSRFELNAHKTERRGMFLLYFKGQEAITDTLSIMGAQKARFAMDELIIKKDLRNRANRAVNCDSANVQRTISAAEKQRISIERVLGGGRRHELSPEMLEAAQLRLANPELSLEELGKLCDPPIGKSGIYHRLQKIERMAAETEGA
ncbi:MAG: DNA-binding protein WhiA [Clostridia bacterium]|nr:DNA-binding protein WhiA [Clostridia bacterium]